MSIIASYERLSPEEFHRMLEEPQIADEFFGIGCENETEEQEAASLARLAEREAIGRYLEIGRRWHGLHFLVTGEADYTEEHLPLSNVVLGGADTPWQGGYYMIRFLDPTEVKEVSDALEALTDTEVQQRLDPDAFNAAKLYGSPWDENKLHVLGEMLARVRQFFRDAARNGEVILLDTF